MFNDSISTTPPPPTQQEPIHGTSSSCWDCCYYNYNNNHRHSTSSPDPCTNGFDGAFFNPPPPVTAASASVPPAARRKRRRTKNAKNEEEIESQRMTHIAVERNRRKQMNEYLALLRSLMPSSYVQRGDQASIIGGAINYVKELEQQLQAMEAQKAANHQHAEHDDDGQAGLDNGRGDQASIIGGAINFVKELEQLLQAMEAQKAANHHQQHAQNHDHGQAGLTDNGRLPSPLFFEFFAFPQYSTRNQTLQAQSPEESSGNGMAPDSLGGVAREAAVGEIEVTMAESHANVKILARKQHRQLVKLVAGLQGLGLTILHLNVTTTTSDQMVLYTVSFKVEEGCYLNTVDEIAAAVNQMLRRIIEEGSYTGQAC
ncbi:unnamed protein product [Linum tenue]|uniref:BHLH domain-containing protein n=1 Tax=Linum tenue TaxID=586396 RepID=A0AAV0N6S8_9ROSI|nr:unnamed protein product [Linum tenue]